MSDTDPKSTELLVAELRAIHVQLYHISQLLLELVAAQSSKSSDALEVELRKRTTEYHLQFEK